jgi:lysozyme family protein
MNDNWPAALAFVWARGRDSPQDGYHVTPGDKGLGTFGGVTQATWDDAVKAGIVRGMLAVATIAQLSAVLQKKVWEPTCDELPHGLDLLYFNGHMMSGYYPKLLQQGLGMMGDDDVDGWIGPESLKAVRARDVPTLIDALSGIHWNYLTRLDEWAKFGGGWTTRLRAAQVAAHGLADGSVGV